MLIQNPKEFRENLRIKLQKFIKKKQISINLEKAIKNYCIHVAKKKR